MRTFNFQLNDNIMQLREFLPKMFPKSFFNLRTPLIVPLPNKKLENNEICMRDKIKTEWERLLRQTKFGFQQMVL
jgi:hypothetical protein